jgi:hypothetical protein
VGTPFSQFPAGSPSRAIIGSPAARLTPAGSKAAPGRPVTTNLQRRILLPRTNNSVLGTNRPAPRTLSVAPRTNSPVPPTNNASFTNWYLLP